MKRIVLVGYCACAGVMPGNVIARAIKPPATAFMFPLERVFNVLCGGRFSMPRKPGSAGASNPAPADGV
jgi:hypothetical protein